MLDTLFDGSMLFFSIPAIAGSAFFALRMVMMLAGGLAETDAGDASGADDHHSTDAFKLLSVQAVTAFLMGFGWVGLGARISLGWEFGTSALLGAAGGAAMVWLMAWMFRTMFALQSSGNVNIADAVGREGSVYVTVPAHGEGRGQVRVVIDERARTYNAVSLGDAIPSQARVRVLQVNDDQSLTVSPVT
jgi:hypothetical protein